MKQLAQKIEQIKKRFGIVGNSPAFNHAIEMAIKVANTDMNVLLVGENGTGKEVFFKIIHHLSPRRHEKLVAVNCGAIPEGTINSELFGHEKGAFTGASDSRKGYFEEANKGTIFLDEIGEMPLRTQPILLRVLENSEYMRVGSSQLRKTDVRVVSATNINLGDHIRKGKFREDLFYRIAQVRIVIPPLRKRGEDIYLLFRKFALEFAERYDTPLIQLEPAAKAYLLQYPFSGNVRQLRNVTWQVAAFESVLRHSVTKEVLMRYLPAEGAASSPLVPSPSQQPSSPQEQAFLYKTLFQLQKDVVHIKSVLFPNGHNAMKPYDALEPYADVRSDASFFKPSDTKKPLLAATPQEEPAKKTLQAADKEDLSLRANIERVVAEALARNTTTKDAARELQISERTLYRWLKKKRASQPSGDESEA